MEPRPNAPVWKPRLGTVQRGRNNDALVFKLVYKTNNHQQPKLTGNVPSTVFSLYCKPDDNYVRLNKAQLTKLGIPWNTLYSSLGLFDDLLKADGNYDWRGLRYRITG